MTGILGTYAHLLITTYLRSDTALGSTTFQVRFNGDSGANYDTQSLVGNAASATAAESFGQVWLQAGVIPAATAGANLFCGGQIFIPNYAGSANNKQVIAIDANKVGTSTTNLAAHIFGSSWRSNAAINRITFLPGAGNFAAGSRITIHAMGA